MRYLKLSLSISKTKYLVSDFKKQEAVHALFYINEEAVGEQLWIPRGHSPPAWPTSSSTGIFKERPHHADPAHFAHLALMFTIILYIVSMLNAENKNKTINALNITYPKNIDCEETFK